MSEATTRRRQLAEMLEMGFWGFEELRRELQVTVGLLEDDLRHLEKSARASRRKLLVEPAACADCGFLFRDRAPRHFHPPSRCPECKSERLSGPRLALS